MTMAGMSYYIMFPNSAVQPDLMHRESLDGIQLATAVQPHTVKIVSTCAMSYRKSTILVAKPLRLLKVNNEQLNAQQSSLLIFKTD